MTIAFSLTVSAYASDVPTIYQEVYSYSQQISAGHVYIHQHVHYGAISAYAYLTSSTGPVGFTYQWNPPVLKVWISNRNSYEVTAQWNEVFYVN